MKKLIACFTILLAILACDKDEDAPPNNNSVEIQTLSHTINPDGGVTLVGQINNVELPIDYGFLIGTSENTNFNTFATSKFNTGVFNGQFTIDFKSDLREGVTYYYKSLALKNGIYVYGEEKAFLSNGSATPIINNIEPIKAHLGDTITIKGLHFSSSPKVYFNTRQANLLIKSDTLIKGIVTNNTEYNNDRLPSVELKLTSVTLNEVINNQFSLYTPRVDAISPENAFPGDTLTLHGDHFALEREGNRLYIPSNSGTSAYPRVIKASRTELEFIIREISAFSPTIELEAQSQTIAIENKFKHVLPEFSGISKTSFKYGERMVIYGTNFPRSDGYASDNLKYSLGTKQFPNLVTYKDSLVVEMKDSSVYEDFIINGVNINFFGRDIRFDQTIELDENYVRVEFLQDNNLAYGNLNGEAYTLAYPYFVSDKYLTKFNQETYRFDRLYPNDPYNNAPSGYRFTLYGSKWYGFDTTNTFPNTEFFSYDMFTTEKVQKQPFPGQPSSSPIQIRVGDYLYYGLGRSAISDPISSIWRYSFIDDTWEFVIDFPDMDTFDKAKVKPLTFTIGSKIYIAGGQPDFSPQLQDFWEFNTATNSITQKSDVPIQIPGRMIGFSYNGKGFIDVDGKTYSYNPTTDTWAIKEAGMDFGVIRTFLQKEEVFYGKQSNYIIKTKKSYFEDQ